MAKYDVYGIGNALVDMEFAIDDDFLHQNSIDKGMMTLVDQDRQTQLVAALKDTKSKKAGGGSAANTIFAANYFGSQCYYSCKVAADEAGDFFKTDLAQAGVDSNLTDLPQGTTGKCLVMVTPDAERTMNTFLGISEEISTTELNEEAIKNSEYIYLEGYLVTSPTGRAAAIKAREIAKANGVKVAITFSDPAMVMHFKDGLAEMIGDGVDLLFCNEEEAKLWADTADLSTAVETLQATAKTFAITLGSEGALAFDGETAHKIAPNSVTAIDSNGAGDMFAGAFIYGITQGKGFAEAGKLASLASSEVVSQFGPRLAPERHPELLKKAFS